ERRARPGLTWQRARAIQVDEAGAESTLNNGAGLGLAALGLKEVGRRAAAEAERKVILEVLERVRWNRSEAARILKVSYKTLLNKIAEGGLNAQRTSRAG